MAWDNTARAEAERSLRESEDLYRKLAQSLHESESRLRQILEAMTVGVIVTGRDGKLLSVNLLARQLLYRGAAAQPLVRAGTYETYPAGLLPTARALQGEVSQCEDVEVLTPQGPVPLLITGSPVVDAAGVPELAVTVFMDMTAQRQLAAAQSDFISTVSHELRTPFTSIRGSLALLVGGVAGPLPERVRPLVEIALRNSERLLILINDLLDIQRLESGNMELSLQELELTPLVEQALEDNNAFASQLGVTFRLFRGEAGLRVRVDPNRLLQLMANLLSNAAKFSPLEGTVEIGVERHSGWARVSVRDQGRGIPPEFRSRIFSRFAQADSSSTREKGGTGLGLSICKALIERMGGFISFTTLIGEGTTFFFDLPLVGLAGRTTAES
jgi:signal transduction histidine kinase